MLREAVKARLPLISVRSDEGPYTEAVLEAVLGPGIRAASSVNLPNLKGDKPIYYCLHPANRPHKDWDSIYKNMESRRGSVVLVNPEESSPAFYDAGDLMVPDSAKDAFFKKHVVKKNRKAVKRALSGTTYREVVEACKLAMASTGELTGDSVAYVRGLHMDRVVGLQSISVDVSTYIPAPHVIKWAADVAALSKPGVPEVLRPRGALLAGASGTGKTMAARYLASVSGLPLYRLEMGLMLSKWHGESDKNLVSCLEAAERTSPCVLLIDEVEKLFSAKSEDGIVSRLLATLLWWLQERRSPVYTLMTTNARDDLPAELIRPGRLDRVVEFPLIKGSGNIDEFARKYIELSKLDGLEGFTIQGGSEYTPAEVVERVLDSARLAYLDDKDSA